MGKKITVEIKDHVCSEDEHGSFVLQDVRDMAKYNGVEYDNIIEIDHCRCSAPGKGYGSLLLQDYLSEIPSNTIVIVKAEPMHATEDSYNKAVESGDFEASLSRLVSFYSKNGFLDINEYVGYEFGVAMMYGNSIGKTMDLCFRKYKSDNEKENVI